MNKRFLAACVALAYSLSAQACPAVFQKQALEPLMGGKPVPLCSHGNKTVLIVNTASQCGYTPQYTGLEALHKRYAAKGLVVIGIPANDFGAQEPGSNKSIADFCEANFGVSFFMAAKIDEPIAKNALFAGLAGAAGGPQKPALPKWNFHKYLVTANGKVQSFASAVEPLSPELVKAVESALP